jgi:hypothetical protein
MKWTIDRSTKLATLVALVVGSLWGIPKAWDELRISAIQLSEMQGQITSPRSMMCVVKLDDPAIDGRFLYDVTDRVAVKNSSGQGINITYSLAKIYLGSLPGLGGALISEGKAVFLNTPPNPLFKDPDRGWAAAGDNHAPAEAISWRQVGSTASRDLSFARNDQTRLQDVDDPFAKNQVKNSEPEGGLTETVAAGDTTGTEPEFLLRAKPEDFVGAVVAYGIDDTVVSPSPKINLTNDMRRLSNSDQKDSQQCKGPL